MHNVSQDDYSETDVEYVLAVQREELNTVNSRGAIHVEMDVRHYGTVKF